MTFLSNPATTPFILGAALYIGDASLHMGADLTQFEALLARGASLSDWAAWLVSSAAPAVLWGLLVIAIVSAAIGYVLAVLGWRFWLVHKWRTRGRKRASTAA
jgi:uncharacterized protein (DUF2062 family)